MSATSLQYLPNQKQFCPYSYHTVTKLEIITYICCIPLGLLHFFAPQNFIGLIVPGIFFIIVTFCWHYYGGLQFKLFRQYILKQFRTIVVLFSLFMIVLLHTISYFVLLAQYKDLSSNNNPTYPILVAIFDDIFWCLVIFVLIEGDTIYPKPSNISRFILPLYATINCIVSIYRASINMKQYDCVFIRFKYGEITYWNLWQASFFQLAWFLCGIIFAVFRDPKHLLCSWATQRVLRKRYLTNIYYHKYTKFTKHLCGIYLNITFPTWILLILISILGIPMILLYIINGDSSTNKLWEADMLIVFTILLLILLFILIYYHFEWHLSKKLLKQFRCQLLFGSIGLLTYTMIQKIIWNSKGKNDNNIIWDKNMIICNICFHIVYYIMVIIITVRDGIIYTFPWLFTMIFAIILCILSVYNIIKDMFLNQVIIYPSWFLFIEKEAYFQIASMCILIIWKLIKDKKHIYFVLIRQHLKREILFQSLNKFGMEQFENDMYDINNENNINNRLQLTDFDANDTEYDNDDDENEVFPSYYKQDTFLMQQNL